MGGTDLEKVANILGRINELILAICRQGAWILLILMTVSILIQVWYRYVLNAALPWPEEAARAMMIWMIACAAPTAYRRGGFVAIDLVSRLLPAILRTVLTLVILVMCFAVLWYLFTFSVDFFERGFKIYTSTLRLPVMVTDPDTGAWSIGLAQEKIRIAWVRLAMPICFGLLMLVTAELIARVLSGKAEIFEKTETLAGAE